MGLGNRYQPTNGPATPGVIASMLPGGVMPGGEPQALAAIQFDPYSDAKSDLADGSGVAEVTFGPAPYLWLVTRMVVFNDGAASSNAFVYVGTVDPKNLKDLTGSGNLDVADEVNAIRVPPGASLIVRWTGATPTTSTSTASIEYWQQRP